MLVLVRRLMMLGLIWGMELVLVLLALVLILMVWLEVELLMLTFLICPRHFLSFIASSMISA